MVKKIVVSGIQPTGNLHFGNYLAEMLNHNAVGAKEMVVKQIIKELCI